ncbi:MAG: hypothetical protein ACRYHQ_11590, partial [Janthinobacterium lividum]
LCAAASAHRLNELRRIRHQYQSAGELKNGGWSQADGAIIAQVEDERVKVTLAKLPYLGNFDH